MTLNEPLPHLQIQQFNPIAGYFEGFVICVSVDGAGFGFAVRWR